MLISQDGRIVYNLVQIVYIEIRMAKIVIGTSSGADFIVGMYSSQEAAKVAFDGIVRNLQSKNAFVKAMSDERAAQLANE